MDNLTGTITVIIIEWHARAVDGQLLKVGAPVAIQLGVEIREQTALKKGVIGEIDTSNDVARLELFFNIRTA